jgi:glycosyltransferase involved in cell wall biosynthesis
MKTAIVHDYLSQRGGAERLVLGLCALFPDAPLYTSIYAPERTYPAFKDIEVRTSVLQQKGSPDQFRKLALWLPGAFSKLDLSQFDQVVISTSGFAHHVRHDRTAVYCHTPPHFLYDTRAYLGSRARAALVRAPFAWLRHLDRAAAARHRSSTANSVQTSRRIKTVYGRDSTVIYPPLATGHLPDRLSPPPRVPRALVIARLLPYKRIDVAIAACRRAGIGLTIVGEGPEEGRLRRFAADGDVVFLGRQSDDELRDLFEGHSVVLAPGLEDFGYGPVEANYAGRPVVALRAGGALETVEDGVNGILVDSWDETAWSDALGAVLARAWSPVTLRATTDRFGLDVFRANVTSWLDGIV